MKKKWKYEVYDKDCKCELSATELKHSFVSFMFSGSLYCII